MTDADRAETAETLLRELWEACRGISVYPQGALGFETLAQAEALAEAEGKARRFLKEREEQP